jgi:hypothetical protein
LLWSPLFYPMVACGSYNIRFVWHNDMVILILQDHDFHGPEFHKHMLRINKSSGSNITVTM